MFIWELVFIGSCLIKARHSIEARCLLEICFFVSNYITCIPFLKLSALWGANMMHYQLIIGRKTIDSMENRTGTYLGPVPVNDTNSIVVYAVVVHHQQISQCLPKWPASYCISSGMLPCPLALYTCSHLNRKKDLMAIKNSFRVLTSPVSFSIFLLRICDTFKLNTLFVDDPYWVDSLQGTWR